MVNSVHSDHPASPRHRRVRSMDALSVSHSSDEEDEDRVLFRKSRERERWKSAALLSQPSDAGDLANTVVNMPDIIISNNGVDVFVERASVKSGSVAHSPRKFTGQTSEVVSDVVSGQALSGGHAEDGTTSPPTSPRGRRRRELRKLLTMQENDPELLPDDPNNFFGFQEKQKNAEAASKRALPLIKTRKFKVWFMIAVGQLIAILIGTMILVYGDRSVKQTFQLWRWFYLIALLPAGWLLANLLTLLLIVLVEKTMMTVVNALYFAYALRKHIRWVMRALNIFLCWTLMMTIQTQAQDSGVNQVYEWIARLLGCVIVFTLGNLVKRLLAKMMALKFHATSHHSKMTESLRKEHYLKALLRPRMRALQNEENQGNSKLNFLPWKKASRENYEIDIKIDDTLKSDDEDPSRSRPADAPHDMRALPLPQFSMKSEDVDPHKRARMINNLSKLEHYVRKSTFSVTFRDELNRVEESNLNSEMEVNRVAYYLFWNVKADMATRYIQMSDLENFLYPAEIPQAFETFDVDKDGKISLMDCAAAVGQIYKERSNLASTLRDARSINKTLEVLIGLSVHVLFIFFYLMIFNTGGSITDAWISFSGILLAFSFLFAGAAQIAFENIIFLYSVRSYVTGDILLVDGDYLEVTEMSINYTCFSSDINRKVWIPNNIIRQKTFVNLSDSGSKFEAYGILVDFDSDPTLLTEIEDMLARLHKESPKEYGPSYRCKYSDSVDPFKVKIQVLIEYTHPGIDLRRTAFARSAVLEKIAEILRARGIPYTLPAIRGENPQEPGATIDVEKTETKIQQPTQPTRRNPLNVLRNRGMAARLSGQGDPPTE
ncbi:hypothetical protein M9435_004019 [Picochlorum sp. BPE23]|nr:hypothetical protein M9435_004019 [Picochlorum sp. BPE23]